jgi:hypothetical protein
LRTYGSDIFCFQEIRPELIDLFDEPLAGYRRVEGADAGWRCESSIYVRNDMFCLVDCGRVDLAMPEPEREFSGRRSVMPPAAICSSLPCI